jgi:hypothetical protein
MAKKICSEYAYKIIKDTVEHIDERKGSECELEICLLDLIRLREILNKYEGKIDGSS